MFSFWLFFINALLKLVVLIPKFRVTNWLVVICRKLSFLTIVTVKRQGKTIIKSRYLWTWCVDIFLSIIRISLVVLCRLWSFYFVCTTFIMQWLIFSYLLRIFFAFRTQIKSPIVSLMFHHASFSWTLLKGPCFRSFHQRMRICTLLNFVKWLFLAFLFIRVFLLPLILIVLLLSTELYFWLVSTHFLKGNNFQWFS